MAKATDLDHVSTWDNIDDFLKCCRVCMSKRTNMQNIFGLENSQTVKELKFCTGILLTEDDGLPVSMCDTCLQNLSVAYKFKKLCIHSDEIFRKKLGHKIIKNDLIKKEVVSDTEYEETKIVMEMDINFNEEESPIKIEVPSKPQRKKQISNDKTTNKEPKQPDVTGELVPDENQKFVCEPCNLKFTEKELLMEHKRKVHVCEWICEICGKQFKHKPSVYPHMQSHLPPKYSCEHCDYKTSNGSDLKKHVRIHTGIKKYICEHCPAGFYSSSNLRDHFRRHHNGGLRTRACPRCDLTFTTTSNLSRHMEGHDKIQRFECDVCHTHFTFRKHWKRHLLKQHDIVVPKIKPGRRKVNIVRENLENKPTV